MHICVARSVSWPVGAALIVVLAQVDGSAQGAPAPVAPPAGVGAAPMFGRAAVARALAEPDARFDRGLALGARNQPKRACPGCPERRVLRPYLESLALQAMYNGINHLRGHHTARIGFSSWWANMKHGFEWDPNDWGVNQFGHQYQGSNYFTAGRANGLTFWESSAVAAFGSATWEYFAENNRASLNDFINTTVGGIVLGEVLHRSAWLVRDPTKAGKGRREIVAAIIDPMSGLERGISGDFGRVTGKPAHLVPSSVGWRVAVGAHAEGASFTEASTIVRPYVDFDLRYGDARAGRSETPFEAFTAQVALGNKLSHLAIHGRLFGRPFGDAKGGHFSLVQTYEFITNPAYAFGGQGFEAQVGVVRPLSRQVSLWLAATGGATILAAADSPLLPPNGVIVAPPPNGRKYDYGPGVRLGGTAEFSRNGQPLASVLYQAYQVNVVDGTRANHVLQRLYVDLRVPVARQLAVGAAAEYFFRTAHFWGAGSRSAQSHQIRVFLSWSGS